MSSDLCDVVYSKLREVPDNQEVWIDKDGFTSIIFDITERVGPAGSGLETDGRALTVHLEDLVGSDIDTVKVWNTTETQFTNLECVNLPFAAPKTSEPIITVQEGPGLTQYGTTVRTYRPTPLLPLKHPSLAPRRVHQHLTSRLSS